MSGSGNSVVAVLAILFFALGPHLYFLYKRGAEWNGSFPLTHGDELQQALHKQRDAAVGTLIVLTLGSVHLVAYYFWSGESSYNYLGFLRRYVPSAAFPFLFVICGTVFRAIQLKRDAGAHTIARLVSNG